ncbi:MAG TPA: DUF4382 domain-containing protein [Longimicrobiales bacterium]|nr:DUF4382 domain-containing protein [Longimicrobiales bacterium]
MSLRTFRTLTLLAMALPFAACSDGTDVASPGAMTLLLTDEEGDFTQAWVTIERVEVVGSGPPLAIMTTSFTTDLLTLSNDVATLVDDATIPGGTYTEIRFIIPGACIGVEQSDGSELVYASTDYDECGDADGGLVLPSFAETGIKVNFPGGSIEVDGDSKVYVLDFDVSQSFGQQAGLSGDWVMTPVINATEISLTGSIVVELTAATEVDLASMGSSLADFQARLETEAVPQPFTDDDQDDIYTATFLYLVPGATYDLSLGLRDGVSFGYTLDPTSPQSVSLSSGEEATVAFQVTSASPTS